MHFNDAPHCLTTLSSEPISESQLSLFPNPSQGVLNIEGIDPSIEQFEISDIYGRIYQTGVIQNQLQVENLVNGVYYISFFREDGNGFTKTFVKM